MQSSSAEMRKFISKAKRTGYFRQSDYNKKIKNGGGLSGEKTSILGMGNDCLSVYDSLDRIQTQMTLLFTVTKEEI